MQTKKNISDKAKELYVYVIENFLELRPTNIE